MKKSLILIAIALMVLVPVFAVDDQTTNNGTSSENAGSTSSQTTTVTSGLGDNKTTKVETEVKLEPKYEYEITSNKLSAYDSTLTKQDVITLTRVAKENKLSTETAYVSYKFTENEGVALYIKIDGNMLPKKDDGSDDTARAGSYIPVTLTVESTTPNYSSYDIASKTYKTTTETNTTAVTINSDDSNTNNLEKSIVSYSGTNKVGDVRWCSAKLTVGQKAGTDLTGVQLGYYLATITLTTKTK